MALRLMKPLLSSSTCLLYFFFLVGSFWCYKSINAQQAATDPSEVRALNSIFQQWDTQAADTWNISGEPCSGFALSQSDSVFDDPSNNPAIKCDCSFRNNTLCHITSLRVYALDKRGVIPEELLDLPYLTFLKLDRNFFSGRLPAFIGNMSRLGLLSISHNDLSGPIPKELGNLKDLYYLGFGVNNFSGTLTPELGNLVKLGELSINSCGLGGEIPSTFANLVELRTVWASDNAFTGKIPDFVGNKWTKLTSLRFQGNSFEGPIPSSFANLTSLNSLRIGDIYNGSSSLDFVRNLKNLTDLVLRNVLLTGFLPYYITELQSLQKLDLSFNNLTGAIPSNMFTMGSLMHFLSHLKTFGSDINSILHTIEMARFLGNNSLSGAIPSQKSEALQTIDLSYNLLSGNLPSWVNSGLQLNLVGNNFSLNSLNIWRLPGLECLQRSFPCNRDAPRYSKFSIKCGGPQIISNGIVFEADYRPLGAATYVVTGAQNWAVSNVGIFADRQNEQYEENTLAQVRGTNTPELYRSSRLSPGSLRYYGLGLENGLYTVNLFFAETGFPDRSSQSWKSLARRVFDVYIQGTRRLRDFDISKEAGGVERALIMNFTVNVTENHLEIHLFWAGKGTYCTPEQGYYGPSISAISVVPNFIPTAIGSKEKNWTEFIIVITVSVVVLALILVFSIFYMKRRKDDDEEEELCPKISDFGLAKLYDDRKTHISTRVAGTIGYLAPEYAMRGHLTEKADVFGFGIVALEILSGRPNSDKSLEGDKIYLLEWAWVLHEKTESLDLVDPNLIEFNENEALRVVRVALLCTQGSPSMRPPMSRVVAMLAGDVEVNGVISRPSYLTDWDFKDLTGRFVAECTQTSIASENNDNHNQNMISSVPGAGEAPIQ
ncbi:hypothetical protein V6N12_024909 [Hibiscus sabdariffa]|uniref:non-specific serine/threonine protein kinase n=1 Tax=Hibiscus sabdariffa TaxID=183260 RepID=A0ABR1ZY13_9ROSI